MSDSNKTDTNKESLSYLVLYSYSTDEFSFDNDSYIISDSQKIEDIVKLVQTEWDSDIEINHLAVIPFYRSQIKRIKQTLELV